MGVSLVCVSAGGNRLPSGDPTPFCSHLFKELLDDCSSPDGARAIINL